MKANTHFLLDSLGKLSTKNDEHESNDLTDPTNRSQSTREKSRTPTQIDYSDDWIRTNMSRLRYGFVNSSRIRRIPCNRILIGSSQKTVKKSPKTSFKLPVGIQLQWNCLKTNPTGRNQPSTNDLRYVQNLIWHRMVCLSAAIIDFELKIGLEIRI